MTNTQLLKKVKKVTTTKEDAAKMLHRILVAYQKGILSGFQATYIVMWIEDEFGINLDDKKYN